MLQFIKFKWFDASEDIWIIDYILENSELSYVLSVKYLGAGPKYSFCMAKKLAENLNELLENSINLLFKDSDNPNLFRVINLGLNSDDGFVSGTFEISDDTGLD